MFRGQVVIVLVIAAMLAACTGGGTAPAPPSPAAPTPATAAAEVKLEPTAAPTATVQPSQTAPPSATPTLAPTDTVQPSPTATRPPTSTPSPSATPPLQVTVKSETLNVRGGPGSNYPVAGSAHKGDALTVMGQAEGCAWLAIQTGEGVAGWVTGAADFVNLNVRCETIPEAAVPPTPTPAPTLPPPPTAAAPAIPPTETAAPAEPTAAAEPELPSDKGCYLFISYIGDELTVTFSAKGRQWDKMFKVAPMGQHVECFDPGNYSYTINHPKWTGGGTLTVEAGKHYRFPLIGRP